MEAHEEKLRQEILDEAARRAERIIARANADAGNMRRRAEEENRSLHDSRLAECRREAEAVKRTMAERARTEGDRLWLEAQEACFEELVEAVMRTAQELPPGGVRRMQSLLALVGEALEGVGTDGVVLHLALADAPFVDARWLREHFAAAPGEAGVEVEADPSVTGGVMAVRRDGRRSYDNTFAARRERLMDHWRALAASSLENEGRNGSGESR